MSEFKWVPEAGDKFVSGNRRGVVIHRSRFNANPKNWFYDENEFKVDSFGCSWPEDIKPRGNKTKARYAAAKAKWESEQVYIYAVGDYVVCNSRIISIPYGHVMRVSGFTGSLARPRNCFEFINSAGELKHIYKDHVRKATPVEIEAHKQSLKTVWDLQLHDDCWLLGNTGFTKKIKFNTDLAKHRERGLIHMTEAAAVEADNARVEKFSEAN